MSPTSHEALILRTFCQSVRQYGMLPSRDSNQHTSSLTLPNDQNHAQDSDDGSSLSDSSISNTLSRNVVLGGGVKKTYGNPAA